MKICTSCNKEKDEADFHKDSHAKCGLSARCKPCRKSQAATRYLAVREKYKPVYKDYYERNKEYIAKRSKVYRDKMKVVNPKVQMVRSAKTRAKNQGLEFNITASDFEIPSICPILGIQLFKSDRSGANPNSPSLDRLIPSRGYTKGNVWVISKLANYMKNSASFGELQMFANWINNGMLTGGQIPEHDERQNETL